MKSSTFQTDEAVDLHVAWLIQRQRQKQIEKRKGVGSVIFVTGIPLAIVGFAMSLVAYSEIVGKDTIPAFRISGPVCLVVAFVLFLVGALLAEVLTIRRNRKQQYEIESIELQSEFLQDKENISEEDSSIEEMTRESVRRSGDETLFQQFKRSSSVISESLVNMLPSRNCKIEPHECEDIQRCEDV
ncbi:uncharacterized protein LOC117330586 [Pecten maximus]|uniref:uncharacterized protein LOC117330586 n=1 Tax=Pecten maximus TaxID=6579 RepID=UPI0014589402|nr:uncharacterized protein LOC117330586 [Pecten maximus]XP_033744901.1 uncharacterized protein LOC117330586 [Pecten maximus]